MAFLDVLNQVAKNIGEKTNDVLETSKLSSRINAEQTAADENLKKIGAYYYTLYDISGEAAPEILEFCQAAKDHYAAVAEAQHEIERIKVENEAAKVAAAQVVPPMASTSTQAGSTDGTAAGGLVCPSCGAINSSGTKFCKDCGTKLEPVMPQERICPSCGAAVAPGVRFCSECGQRLDG